MEPEELLDLTFGILANDKEDFMPDLTGQIEYLLGKGNYVYDFGSLS